MTLLSDYDVAAHQDVVDAQKVFASALPATYGRPLPGEVSIAFEYEEETEADIHAQVALDLRDISEEFPDVLATWRDKIAYRDEKTGEERSVIATVVYSFTVLPFTTDATVYGLDTTNRYDTDDQFPEDEDGDDEPDYDNPASEQIDGWRLCGCNDCLDALDYHGLDYGDEGGDEAEDIDPLDLVADAIMDAIRAMRDQE